VKFFGGFLVGLVVGPLLLVGSIATFIAGAFLGWKVFGDVSSDPITPEDST